MEGQDVLLDKGYTKIEEIQSGDTIDGSVIYKIFKQPSSESMVKLPKNCFGMNIPDSDVYVTYYHLMCDPKDNKMKNAISLVDEYESVIVCEPPKQFVYNILMKE